MLKILISVVLAAALLNSSTSSAGGNTMLKLLEVLHHNGTIDRPTYEMLVDAARAEDQSESAPGSDTSSPLPAVANEPIEEQEAPAAAAQATVEYSGGGLRVTSADRQYRSVFNGYLQLDAARYNDADVAMGDGGEIRRARLGWRGLIGDAWLFRTSVEFANGADIKSTYIDYRPGETSSVRFGKFKQPLNMEELTSARYTTFMERALVNALAPGRNFGLGYNTDGQHHSFKAGAYIGEAEDEADPGLAVAGRLTYAPWTERTRVLHLGMAASYQELEDGGTVRFSSRPESHVTDVRFVDTSDILDGNVLSVFGLEAAGLAGPWSLQGEYIRTELDRNGSDDLVFDGWYISGSWIMTGESREYDAGNGRFRRVRPDRPYGGGGAGAWELALRYSNLDLNDGDIFGGEEDNLTLGLNWYPRKDIRFSLNYVDVLDVERPGSAFDGESPDIIQVRGQVQF